jgi:hypothetical protein
MDRATREAGIPAGKVPRFPGIMAQRQALAVVRHQQASDRFVADHLAATIGCEVTPHPSLQDRFEARNPVPGVWLLTGTAEEILAEVEHFRARAAAAAARASQPREWLPYLGSLGRPA